MLNFLIRYQIIFYLLSILMGLFFSISIPNISTVAGYVMPCALMFLMYLTFLPLPLKNISTTIRSHFTLNIFLYGGNFLFVPFVVFFLLKLLPDSSLQNGILIGACCVLLAPCIDYVITFSHLARSNSTALLLASPLLLIGQMILIPIMLPLLTGSSLILSPVEFIKALTLYIFIPLLCSILTQKFADSATASNKEKVYSLAEKFMPPVMMITLITTICKEAHHLPQLGKNFIPLAFIYILFPAIMIIMTWIVYKFFSTRLMPTADYRALAFSLVTRNALVILPLALSISSIYPLAPLATITQTTIELPIMALMTVLIPKLFPTKHDNLGK